MEDTVAGGMSVVQLAERSGVGVPSIHHYRRLGLLPPPTQVAANRFRYDERHVEALRAIRLLRERRGLPLATIRELLPEVLATADQPAFRPEMWDAVLALSELVDPAPEETRARLVEVARTAFVARGYGGVNVEQLCQQAGIAKGSFYRYFASKDAIYEAAARSVVDVVAAAAGRWRRPLRADAAVQAVASVLRPVVILLVEVVVRAAHGEPTLGDLVPEVVAGIADVVAPHLEVPPDGTASGPAASTAGALAAAVADQAVAMLLRQVVGLGSGPRPGASA
jgi:AcrR family transcriptional regulator